MIGPVVAAVDSGTDFWGTTASEIQTGITVTGQYISGTLHKLTSGQLVTDWGQGYFLGLDFASIPEGAVVKVGLVPSQGSGFVSLDEDHNGVFKITDKNTQVFQVITKKDGEQVTDTYYLSTLTLEE